MGARGTVASIRLENVTKRYGKSKTAVIDKINLEIEENEFLILVGPSGCGKTTTLRMIAGLETITEGKIYIGDTLVNDLPPKDRQISMVFQNYALYPHLNVYGNLAFGLKMQKRGKEEIDRKVAEIGRILELESLMDRKPGELSGGQRQRVALGRALIRDTQVMLMDEPLSNLDAKLRVQTRGEILSLHKQVKRTVVYVTHDQVEAMTMGDRVAVMNGGVIQQLDKPETVYRRPVNMFVAGFMGSPPMNFLPCTLRDPGDGPRAECEGLSLKLPGRVLVSGVLERVGQEAVLGVRPEGFEIVKDLSVPHDFTAPVDVVEVLGVEQLVTARLNGQEFTAKVDCSRKIRMGETVGFKINDNKIHIFDDETQRNVSLPE